MNSNKLFVILISSFLGACFVGSVNAQSINSDRNTDRNNHLSQKVQRVIEHWTPERRRQAIPRDLVIDARGLGYLRKPDGSFEPYGHQVAVESNSGGIAPNGKPTPGGGEDLLEPSITDMNPGNGSIIGGSATFSAVITDDSGIKSVSFTIYNSSGLSQSFNPSRNGDTWSIGLQGFSDGNWTWKVTAKDNAAKGGNTAVSEIVSFTVDTTGGSGDSGGGSGTADYIITNAHWAEGGAVQAAAGRIYFEMPANSKRKGPWNGYVCSGTVVDDSTTGRSVIITAAHCVYDDANKAFARNVLFIPNQDATSGGGTDLNCSNDPMGCWAPAFGVVDTSWTTNTFPANIEWDYAFYVVNDTGAHSGTSTISDSLDVAAGSLPVSFAAPFVDDGVANATSDDFTHALGYSYSEDPNFMYCAEDMTTEGAVNWWLANCDLSGGSSGGPWLQPMDISTGSGFIISVNSWGYTTSPGMAGPIFSGTSAEELFTEAKSQVFGDVSTSDGDAGIVVNNTTP